MNYIYITGWDKFQHYKDGRHMTWVKCYTELLNKDEYLELPASDRALLHACWMACGMLGNGRVPADQRLLRARFRLKYVNLERLIHAGFLTVSSRDLVHGSQNALEQIRVEERREEPLTPQAGNLRSTGENPRALGTNPRAVAASEKRAKAVATCRRLYNDCVAEGDQQDAIREHLEREYRHDPSIVLDAVPEWRVSA